MAGRSLGDRRTIKSTSSSTPPLRGVPEDALVLLEEEGFSLASKLRRWDTSITLTFSLSTGDTGSATEDDVEADALLDLVVLALGAFEEEEEDAVSS